MSIVNGSKGSLSSASYFTAYDNAEPGSDPSSESIAESEPPPAPDSQPICDPRLVHQEWFQRGLNEENFALFYASLFPIRDQLSAVIREHLGQPAPADCATIGLLVDQTIHVAFTNRDDWPCGDDIVEWLAHFVDQAIELFESEPKEY